MQEPITTGGSLVITSPALADVDNDGLVEITVGSDDNNMYSIKCPAYGKSTLFPWPMFHHDEKNTGLSGLYTYKPIMELPTDVIVFLIGLQAGGDTFDLLSSPIGLGIVIGTVAAFSILTIILLITRKEVKENQKTIQKLNKKIGKTSVSKTSS